MAIKTYRKKPFPIRGVQWTGDNIEEVLNFISPEGNAAGVISENKKMTVIINGNEQTVYFGDFVYRQSEGLTDGSFNTHSPQYLDSWYDEVL